LVFAGGICMSEARTRAVRALGVEVARRLREVSTNRQDVYYAGMAQQWVEVYLVAWDHAQAATTATSTTSTTSTKAAAPLSALPGKPSASAAAATAVGAAAAAGPNLSPLSSLNPVPKKNRRGGRAAISLAKRVAGFWRR
jgi:hypothetical protein